MNLREAAKSIKTEFQVYRHVTKNPMDIAEAEAFAVEWLL